MTDNKLNLIDTIAKNDTFSTFSRLLASSGATDLITADGPFTVFAPTNDAFGKIPDDAMNALLNETDQPKLKTLLSYHIIPKKVLSADVANSTTPLRSLSGQDITFTDTNGIKVNGSSMQARNIEATNGVVHAIDTVLAPPAAAAAAKPLL